MTPQGRIIVSWPFDNQFHFESRWAPIRELLLKHGFNHRSVTSSQFVLFEGNEESARSLKALVDEIDSEFQVRWEAPTDLK